MGIKNSIFFFSFSLNSVNCALLFLSKQLEFIRSLKILTGFFFLPLPYFYTIARLFVYLPPSSFEELVVLYLF